MTDPTNHPSDAAANTPWGADPNPAAAAADPAAMGAPATPPTHRKRRRRRWPWVLLGLVVLLLLLVALAPALLSTGPVKSLVVSKVNQNLNGTMSIADWSLGWTSGVTINGIRIDDQQGRRVAEISRVRVPASLIAVARGNYDFGDTVIDEPNLVTFELYPDGTNNLEKLVKQQPDAKKDEPKKDNEGPTELPDLKGKLTINRLRATITRLPAPGEEALRVQVDPSTFVVNIPDINGPIANEGTLTYRVNDAPPSTVAINGSVDAIEGNKIDLEKLVASQDIKVTNADLAAAAPFLKKPGEDVTLAGIADGALRVNAKGMKDAAVEGQFNVANFAFGGTALKGDVYRSGKIIFPISVTAAPSGDTTLVTIKQFRAETDHVVVQATGNVTQQALQNVADNKPPGADGAVALLVQSKNLPGLVEQLRNTLGVDKELKLTEGDLRAAVDLALSKDRAAVKQTLDVTAAGTNAGKPVRLEKVHLDTGLTAIAAGGAIPDLRDVAVNLTSAFATIKGGGPSLSNLDLPGTIDLARLRAQLAQFKDMGALDFSGAGDFRVTSRGDLTKPGGTSDVAFTLNLANVAARGLADGKTLNQPRVALNTTATLVRGAEGGDFVERVNKATLAFQSGEANAPVVDVLANAANVTLAKVGVERFEVQRLAVPDLARAQQQFAAFIPGEIRAASGSLATTVVGSYQNDTVAFDHKTQLRNVTLQHAATQPAAPGGALPPPRTFLQDENTDVNAAGSVALGDVMTATINALSVTSSNQLVTVNKVGDQPMVLRMKGSAIGGNGELRIASNLKAVNDAVQAMGGAAPVQTSAGQLTSGLLDATLKLVTDAQNATDITLNGAVNSLSVTTNQQPIQNESVRIALSARTPADFSAVQNVTATIDSSFARTRVTDTNLKLTTGGDNAQPVGTFDMLQSAKVEIAIPDIGRAMAVAQAFAPPTTQPAPAAAPAPAR
ncbi:MAG TPA: hypothetical protein VER17_08985, partial [Tepidisphaeraceae bacterium]|nr:hypothetical protein [Tepidisphaeraceae bacterium]